MLQRFPLFPCPLRSWVALGALVLLAGCAASLPPQSLPSLDAQAPAFKVQASASVSGTASTPLADGRWWTVYGDPLLDALVAQANRDNTDIRMAASRLAQAQALASQSGAARQPQVLAGAGVVRQTGPLLNAAGQEGTLLTAAATLSYEVDVLGRLAQAGDAAALDAQSRQSLLDSVRLLTQAQVVQTYLALRALDGDFGLLQQALALDQQGLRIQAQRLQSGAISEMDYERLHSEATARSLERQVLLQRRSELENGLALLLGQAASTFDLSAAPTATAALPMLPTVRAGLPASVLQRRPDIAAAQKSVLAAQKRLGLSQSAWFPNLSLTASSGFASPELSNLFSASMQTWALGALASLPLFDGGRREAAVAMADAEFSTAIASYHQHILQALREVEDQLAAQSLLAQQSQAMERAWTSAARASELAAARLRNGSISQLDWLSAEQKTLQSRRQLQQLRASRYQTSVALVRALGGGWE